MSFFVTKIDDEFSKISLKEYLTINCLSIDKIKYLFNNKCCYVNGHLVTEDYLLNINDSLCIDTSFYDEIDYIPTEYKLDILYEDDYLLIVNKPAKCIIYDANQNDTMANYIAYHYMINDLSYKVRHVHRLDYDTSGCLVYAKDIITHACLNKMIEDGTFKRYYLAIVENRLAKKEGIIDLAIGKDRHINGKMIVSKTGKKAITHYKVIKETTKYSVVSLKLDTGRTHQIRVHMATIKNPLLGDSLYGSKVSKDRVLLHSHIVEFIHPINKNKISIECPKPEDMNM